MKACRGCGKNIDGSYHTRLYCCNQCRDAHGYQRNKDKIVKRQRKYRKNNKETVYKSHRKSVSRITYQKAKMIHGCRSQAKKKSLPFNLDIDWLELHIAEMTCSVTGHYLEFCPEKPHHPWRPSIDKIIPELGYTKNNCRVVCVDNCCFVVLCFVAGGAWRGQGGAELHNSKKLNN